MQRAIASTHHQTICVGQTYLAILKDGTPQVLGAIGSFALSDVHNGRLSIFTVEDNRWMQLEAVADGECFKAEWRDITNNSTLREEYILRRWNSNKVEDFWQGCELQENK